MKELGDAGWYVEAGPALVSPDSEDADTVPSSAGVNVTAISVTEQLMEVYGDRITSDW